MFLDRSDIVASHPRLKTELHQMRVAGKQLRYLMEVSAVAFKPEFSGCLEELKSVLDLMGRIHDCDVHIPRLVSFQEEIRYFNKNHAESTSRISTAALTRMIRVLHNRRTTLFETMARSLSKWKEDDFKSRLITSMQDADA